MKIKIAILTSLAAISAVWNVNAAITSIADPGGTVSEIGTRIRWGATGFEASIFDSNPFAQTPTLNPGGTPVWNPVSGAPHKFQITFDNVTGALSLAVDFNRDLAFGAGESISRSVFNAPPTTSYVDYGFKYLSISGNEGGNPGRSSVGNLVINGVSMASMTPGGLFLENFYKDSSGSLLTTVNITGEMDFIVAGTSQERPSWNFTLKNSEFAPVPEPSTYIAGALLMIPVLVQVRRWKRSA